MFVICGKGYWNSSLVHSSLPFPVQPPMTGVGDTEISAAEGKLGFLSPVGTVAN